MSRQPRYRKDQTDRDIDALLDQVQELYDLIEELRGDLEWAIEQQASPDTKAHDRAASDHIYLTDPLPY